MSLRADAGTGLGRMQGRLTIGHLFMTTGHFVVMIGCRQERSIENYMLGF